MRLEDEIQDQINAVAERRIQKIEIIEKKLRHDFGRQQASINNLFTNEFRFTKPISWTKVRYLDPYNSRKNARLISSGIAKSIQERKYEVKTPLLSYTRKKDGTRRCLSYFGVADEGVSKFLYARVLEKNLPLFSGHCYAYRSDRSPHDAIHYIFENLVNSSETKFAESKRKYIAEFDFKKFFDSISHRYIQDVLEDDVYYLTELEKYLIRVFINSPKPRPIHLFSEDGVSFAQDTSDTRSVCHGELNRSSVGIPQGTAISNFIANLVLRELDDDLERLGIRFVRFADDILAWSDSYDEISRAANRILAWSRKSGVYVNVNKSNGIRLLVPDGNFRTEIPGIEKIEYLGHSISYKGISPSLNSIVSFKNSVNNIIYETLLKGPVKNTQNFGRLTCKGSVNDNDYILCIMRLRRLIYGKLSEISVKKYSNARSIPRVSLSGWVANFPESNVIDVYRELDGWLVDSIWAALCKRISLLSPGLDQHGLKYPDQWKKSKKNLINAVSYPAEVILGVVDKGPENKIDLTIPSLAKMHKVVRLAALKHGNAIFNFVPSVNSEMREDLY